MGDSDTTEQCWELRLYIAGETKKSKRAIENLKRICDDNLPGKHTIEIIDVKEHPEHARREDIVVTPTLIRHLPLSVRKIIGDLSNKEGVLVGLELKRREYLS